MIIRDYENWLKQKIIDEIKKLDPSNIKVTCKECPICGKNEYLFYPDYDYGRCMECSHEEGLENYLNEFPKQQEIYKKIFHQISQTLNN